MARFSWGVTPDLVAEAQDRGGARSWFEWQLRPNEIPDEEADALASWWPNLTWSPARKWADSISGGCAANQQDLDFARWTLVRRIVSRRQLLEVMTDFWSNLFYIPVPRRESFAFHPRFDAEVRANALGTYENLLKAAILNPAMLCSLNNADSTRFAPNENLGRELLELHTVGHEAGFDESDVLNSTRLLTGYRVEQGGTCRPYYSPDDHYVGPVNVLTFGSRNENPDGRQAVDDYLTYLAHHPATAQRVARRLAVRFVSDHPTRELVDHVAAAFQDSGTDIRTTLRALVSHPAFRDSAGRKVRTPCEDFVNTYRVLQVRLHPPTGGPDDAPTVILRVCGNMGQQPFGWPRPDGFPDVAEAWSSASRMLGSWRIHKNTATGIWPRDQIDYKPTKYWLPALPAQFEHVVERLCRLLFAAPMTSTLLETACWAVGMEPGDEVTPGSTLRVRLLLVSLLDTPDHMAR